MTPIWVTLITGFLGSGKTTLLNALLKRPDLKGAMVIVNEFGEIGVDSDLMTGSSENIVQLANGCLCCSVKSDLIDTLRDLVIQRRAGNLPPFDRVIIETTGIADPIPVLEIILTNPMVRNAYALDGVITVLDAVNGATTLASFSESVKQIAIADRIILTKSDLQDDTDGLLAQVRALNPGAIILQALKGELEADALFGMGLLNAATKLPDVERWLASGAGEAASGGASLDPSQIAAVYREQGHAGIDEAPHHHHGSDIRSFCLVRDEPISMRTLELFLDAIARQAGPRLLRVKGLVHVAGEPRPAVIQGAQKIFHSLDWLDQWPGEDRRTRIVFITRGLEQSQMEDDFALIERIARRTEAAQGMAVAS